MTIVTNSIERRLGARAAIAAIATAIMAAVGCAGGGTNLVKSQGVKRLVVTVSTNPLAQAAYRDADEWYFRPTVAPTRVAKEKVLLNPASHTPKDLGFFATKYGLLTDGHNEPTGDDDDAPSHPGFTFPDCLAAIIKAKEVPQLAGEVHGAGLGVLDGADQEVGQQEEELGEEAEDDALAGDSVSGEEDVDAVSDAELDATEEGADDGCGVQSLDGDIGAAEVELEDVEEPQLDTQGGGSSSCVLLLFERPASLAEPEGPGQ